MVAQPLERFDCQGGFWWAAWKVIGSNKVRVHGCEGEGKEGTVVVLYGQLLAGSLNAG